MWRCCYIWTYRTNGDSNSTIILHKLTKCRAVNSTMPSRPLSLTLHITWTSRPYLLPHSNHAHHVNLASLFPTFSLTHSVHITWIRPACLGPISSPCAHHVNPASLPPLSLTPCTLREPSRPAQALPPLSPILCTSHELGHTAQPRPPLSCISHGLRPNLLSPSLCEHHVNPASLIRPNLLSHSIHIKWM